MAAGHVNARELENRLLVIYFVSLSNGYPDDAEARKHLIDIYEKHKFEVVFVAGKDTIKRQLEPLVPEDDPPEYFSEIFSHMPWTAIPYWDKECRKLLERRFGLSNFSYVSSSFVIGPFGEVLHCHAESLFYEFGPEGFPFTYERLASLCSEEEASAKQRAMETLFRSKMIAIPQFEGDIVNIQDLLFTEYRDYLIKNNGVEVKAQQLEGKVLVIYFLEFFCDQLDGAMHLIDTYNDIHKKGFEVVFVMGTRTDMKERDFKKKISRMPWTAIPYWDKQSRKRLERRFGLYKISYLSVSIIIDPKGKVLHCDAGSLFRKFGPEIFPFTQERWELLRSEYELAAEQPTLKRLLASTERDFVISNDWKKVPISELEGKVVALYLYEHAYTDDVLTGRLIRVYHELKAQGKEFEVVLVYLHFTKDTFLDSNADSFWEKFKTMPWLALPFRDWNCRKLAQVFDYPPHLSFDGYRNPSLVIIGSDEMKPVERYGADLLMHYGIAAYPFTRESAAKIEADTVKNLTLDSLWDPTAVFQGKDGRACFSELGGKRILFYIENMSCERDTEFLMMLEEKYHHSQDEFEVVHFCQAHDKASYDERMVDLPWLVYPFCEGFKYGNKILNHVFKLGIYNRSALIAFERDGRIVTRASGEKLLVDVDIADFPFYSTDMEKLAIFEIEERFTWNN